MTEPVAAPLGVPAGEPGPVRSRAVLGVPLALTDYDGAMDRMDAMIDAREQGYVCAVAVHAVMVAQRDPEMMRALRGSTLTLPDGMPLVWAVNALGERLHNRVYGPELMARHCARAAQQGRRLWLYGGRDQGALVQLTDSLRRRYPGIQIVGGYSPPHRALTGAEEREIANLINAGRPDVVWVGIGVPKQEKWMARMRPLLEAPVLAAVGAAFDFHAGRVKQAPAWMQRRGLEWLYRVAQEPGRLAGRYLTYNPRFVMAFARQYARERRRRG